MDHSKACKKETRIVYVLLDPDTRDVRYVGETKAEGNRRSSHKRAMPDSECPVEQWKRRLSFKRKQALFVRVARTECSCEARQAERFLIEEFASIYGRRLLNRTSNPLWRVGGNHGWVPRLPAYLRVRRFDADAHATPSNFPTEAKA